MEFIKVHFFVILFLNVKKHCASHAPFVAVKGSLGPYHPRQAHLHSSWDQIFHFPACFSVPNNFEKVKRLLTCISTSSESPLGSAPSSSSETPSLVPLLVHWPSCVQTEQIIPLLQLTDNQRKFHGFTSRHRNI